MPMSVAAGAPRKRTFFTSALDIRPKPAEPLSANPPPEELTKEVKLEETTTVPADTPAISSAQGPSRKTVIQNQIRKKSTTNKIKKPANGATRRPKGTPLIERDEVEFQRNRTANARAARLANLARMKEANEKARAMGQPNPYDLKKARPVATSTTKLDEPRRVRAAMKPRPKQKVNTTAAHEGSTDLSDPPPLLLKIPKRIKNADNTMGDTSVVPPLKEYMEAGFYCQDDMAKSPHQLISKVLQRREAEERLKSRKSGGLRINFLDRPSFPPLPYDYGYQLFFEEEQDFVLPFNIRREAETGRLDAKKRPAAYSKLRANTFPERQRMVAGTHAVCKCDPESDCGDNCINRIMSYLCGRDCPAGENCTNRSLAKRKGPSLKVTYTGSRGFGLTAAEDIREGDFVIDYRGEIISLDTFHERCQKEYAVSKNFYALAYDQDEVIDAGARGNEARFINHSCNPNLLVQRFQCLGDGQEEYEVGMWAARDIVAGEELTYDYNFDSFGVSEGAARVQCRCGAPNCVGFLGRKSGEKSAKQIALDMDAEKAARAKVAEIKAKRSKGPARIAAAVPQTNAVAGPSGSGSFWKSREADTHASSSVTPSSDPPQSATGRLFGGLATGGQSIISKIKDSLIGVRRGEPVPPPSMPTPESMDSATFEIPAPLNFNLPPSSVEGAGVKAKPSAKQKKGRQSLPMTNSKGNGDSRNNVASSSTHQIDRDVSPEPLFLPLTKARKAELSAMKAGVSMHRSSGPKESAKQKRKARQTDPGPGMGRNKKKALTGGDVKPAKSDYAGSHAESEDDSDEESPRMKAKQEAIRKRNGAPMGWAYVPITGPPVNAVNAVHVDLPPRRRRAVSYV